MDGMKDGYTRASTDDQNLGDKVFKYCCISSTTIKGINKGYS